MLSGDSSAGPEVSSWFLKIALLGEIQGWKIHFVIGLNSDWMSKTEM